MGPGDFINAVQTFRFKDGYISAKNNNTVNCTRYALSRNVSHLLFVYFDMLMINGFHCETMRTSAFLHKIQRFRI